MKKTALITAILLLLCCLCSCAASAPSDDPEKPNIVSAIFPSYDFAKQVCGNSAEVSLLIPPGNEIHGYEPSLADIALIAECDLFIYAGGESDGWTEDIIKASGNEHITVLSMLEFVDAYETELSESMQNTHGHDHEHGDRCGEHHHDGTAHDGEYDEHVWTSPKNAILITQAICDAVCMLDPANAEAYRKNTGQYTAQLRALDEDFSAMAAAAEKKELIFAERFPFRYLTEEYGFTYDAAFSGCSSDTEPSLATIAHLIAQVEEHRANAVFYIEFSDTTVAEMIAAATNTKPMLLHSCQNVTREEFESGATYLQLMRNNLETLKEALDG